MNWNKWIRQIHRWVSIAFTVTVFAGEDESFTLTDVLPIDSAVICSSRTDIWALATDEFEFSMIEYGSDPPLITE